MKSYYITTPIYYINDHPHLGTAYATILTDVLARFHRSRGEDVFFLTGTDENSERFGKAAQQKGQTPRQLVDEMAGIFRENWNRLNISYDRFIRTTEPDHRRAVEAIYRTLRDRGDIYKGRYEGWYCTSDETFILEAPDGVCPECGRPVERAERESYFFALSRYTERLRELYRQQPDFVVPEANRNEVVRFIEDGLRDMCISRTNNGWGIPVPGDTEQVVYVWFDALVNYIAAIGYPEDRARFEKYWPAALHVVGKEILVRFHATLWPAMLMGAGIPLPSQILSHGHFMIDGQKMSKSRIAQQIARWQNQDSAALRVTGLRPTDLARSLQDEAGIPDDKSAIAVDALRYLLIRALPYGSDAEFNLELLAERYNADLANDLGNLVNRTVSMLDRYRDGVVPARSGGSLVQASQDAVRGAASAFEALQPADAMAQVWRLIKSGNHFIDEKKPWVLQKENKPQELSDVLYALGETCRIAAVLTAPVMPTATAEIVRQLGMSDSGDDLTWEKTSWGRWEPGSRTQKPEPIFPRIDPRTRRDAAASIQGAPPAALGPADPHGRPQPSTPPPNAEAEAGVAGATDEISPDQFKQVHLRIATITAAEKVEGARKLLKLQLDLGDERRQIISGIAERYSPESLVGRQIAVIVNLKPATIRGVQSFGMLLAADVDGQAILLQPDQLVPPGSPVK